MRYFIGKDGKQLGPFNADQIRAKLNAGEISIEDLGWHEGMPEWKPLRTLFPDVGAAPFSPPVEPNSPPSFSQPGASDNGVDFTPNLASRLSRLGAMILDQLFTLILMAPGLWQLIHPFIDDFRNGHSPTPDQILGKIAPALPLLIIPVLVFAIVQIVLLVNRGQTVGKMLLGIRIVKLDGSKAGFGSVFLLRAILPGLIGGIPTVGVVFSLIDVLLIFREDRRCIHDLMAGTIVIEA